MHTSGTIRFVQVVVVPNTTFLMIRNEHILCNNNYAISKP